MSGGAIHPQYLYYQVNQFADELENRIENNNVPDEYGYAPNLPDDILDYLKLQVSNLRKISEVMRATDYLFAGDHGPENFLKIIEKIEKSIQALHQVFDSISC